MHPAERLIEIGAATPSQAPYVGTIEFLEHQSGAYRLPDELSAGEVQYLLQTLRPATESALLQASVELIPDRGLYLHLASSSTVGFAAVGEGNQRLFIQVKPKVGTRRMLELAVAAERLPHWQPDVQINPDDVSSLIEWTIRAFIEAMEELITRGGIRPTHERVRSELHNRVRGKILIPAFLNALSQGRPDRVPCEFSALQTDNEPNRLLRWALQLSIQLAEDLPAKAALQPALRRLTRRFTDVPVERPKRSGRHLASGLPPNLRHYSRALSVANAIIESAYVNADAGSAAASSVALDMNDLYEEAFEKISRRLRPRIRKKPVWSWGLVQAVTGNVVKTLRLEPDIFLPPDGHGHAAILDTKWKKGIAASHEVSLGDAGANILVRPRTADLYQVVSYAVEAVRSCFASDGSCICVLAYPCLGSVPDIRHEIQVGGLSIEVLLLGWDLTNEVEASAGDVWRRIDQARAQHMPMAGAEPRVHRPIELVY